MPQLLFLAALGAGAYMGAKWIGRKAAQFERNMERTKQAAKQRRKEKASHIKDIPELVKDPVTGVYKVKDD